MKNKKKQTFGIIFKCLLVYVIMSVDASDSFEFKNEPFCYFLSDFTSNDINPCDDNIMTMPLPHSLVISPGIYRVHERNYDLSKEGVYRFIDIPNDVQQRIVFYESLDRLIVSLSWIMTQGTGDDYLAHEVLLNKSTNSILSMTCGPAAKFAMNLLQSLGYNARFVTTLTLDQWTSHNNGHSVVEVFHPKLNKWILLDPNKKWWYKKDEELLSLLEVIDALKTKKLKIKKMSAAPLFNISGFVCPNMFDYAFAYEHLFDKRSQMKRFERIFQVPFIVEGNQLFFTCDRENIERVKKYYPRAIYLDFDAFQKRFY